VQVHAAESHGALLESDGDVFVCQGDARGTKCDALGYVVGATLGGECSSEREQPAMEQDVRLQRSAELAASSWRVAHVDKN
jgi:hypothetical protein